LSGGTRRLGPSNAQHLLSTREATMGPPKNPRCSTFPRTHPVSLQGSPHESIILRHTARVSGSSLSRRGRVLRKVDRVPATVQPRRGTAALQRYLRHFRSHRDARSGAAGTCGPCKCRVENSACTPVEWRSLFRPPAVSPSSGPTAAPCAPLARRAAPRAAQVPRHQATAGPPRPLTRAHHVQRWVTRMLRGAATL
jgi:hypothetical protein